MNPNICELLGFGYQSLSDDDSFGVVDTPFCFEDEDSIPVYVETLGSTLRFFDDGAILRRLTGWGVPVDDDDGVDFLNELINPCGASLNGAGEIEVCVPPTSAPAGFAQYVSAMLALVQWEKDQSAAAAARRRDDVIAADDSPSSIQAA